MNISLNARQRPPGQGTRARLLEIGTVDQRPLRYGDPATFYLNFRLTEAVRRFAVGIGFSTRDGQRVLTLDSDAMKDPLNLAAGNHTARLSVDFWPLPENQYHVSCAAIEGSTYPDLLSDVALWDVLPAPGDETTHRSSPNARPPVAVRIESL
jgi:hypothetical protein